MRATKYSCYLAYMTQAIIVNLAPLLFVVFRDEFGLSFTRIGQLILLNFATQIFADLIAMRFAHRLGFRALTIAAHLLCAVGLLLLGILPHTLTSPYLGLCLATLCYAFGGGLLEVVISPIVDAITVDDKASSMSLLHAFFCWGQVLVVIITTLLLRQFGLGTWWLIAMGWAVLPAITLVCFTRVPLPPSIPHGGQTLLGKLFASKVFLIALLMMLCSGASELSMAQWSSLFAEKGLGVSKTMGDLLGPCLFAFWMGIGRTFYGIYGRHIRLHNALLVTSLGCIACYLVTALSHNPFVGLAACSLTGLCVSLMWPGVFSLSIQRFPAGGTMLFGALALAGDFGCAVGPAMTGKVADLTQGGLKVGLLAATIFPIALTAGLLLWKNIKKAES